MGGVPPAVAMFFLLRNLSEGLGGLAKPSMVIGLASIPVNIAGNYIFIYGKFGFPAMGGELAAVGLRL